MSACRILLIALLLAIGQPGTSQLPDPDDIAICQREDSSRVRASPRCVNEIERDPGTLRTSQELEVTTTMTMPAIETHACVATVYVNYTQRNDVADVEGGVENATCAASGGSFVLTVSIRDQNGNPQRREYTQTWQRTDDQDVAYSASYPIGENVDLVRVAAGRIQCLCEASE